MTGAPGWAWVVAECAILGLLAIDLAVNRGQPGMRRAVLVSACHIPKTGPGGCAAHRAPAGGKP